MVDGSINEFLIFIAFRFCAWRTAQRTLPYCSLRTLPYRSLRTLSYRSLLDNHELLLYFTWQTVLSLSFASQPDRAFMKYCSEYLHSNKTS
jgi:hypothetical protein